MDRRSFLAAMLGTAAAPKEVLSGLAAPAPVTKAVREIMWGDQKVDVDDLLKNPGKYMVIEIRLAT